MTLIVFIPPLWSCTSARGPILWRFTHSSRSCFCKRSCAGASLQQHRYCLAKGLFHSLHKAGGWEVKAREVWASWWSSQRAGLGPWRFRQAPHPLQRADLSMEQLFSISWEPQATPNPLSFPMSGSQTRAVSCSKLVWWCTSVSAHLHFKEISLA